VLLLLLAAACPAWAADSYVTATLGGKDSQYPDTLKITRDHLRFDLKCLPAGARVSRAVLRVSDRGHQLGMAVELLPDLPGAKPIELVPPLYNTFDATEAVRAWVARPEANQSFRVQSSGGVDFRDASLEVSYLGKVERAIAPVKNLRAIHQAGQTFLTWIEIEDVVGQDGPTFEQFHQAVTEARAKRSVVYRIYRHDRPITLENLGSAQLVREVPEVVPAWNIRAVGNTEHPNQGHPTMHSPLRPGLNMIKADIVPRYRILDGGEMLPRATGLAVLTTTQAGKRYYAVTAAINGREAVAALDAGNSLAEHVDEKVSTFPATIFQRTLGQRKPKTTSVDIYNTWVDPPYHNLPTVFEMAIIHWDDEPAGSESKRVPLWLVTTTYGGTSAELSPGFFDARHYLRGVFSVGLSEGGIWQGWHECVGTLKGYGQGVVHNYPQRRVLAAADWAMARPDLFIDPERVYFWSQLGSWALRYGDKFAAVMSNGYGNLSIGIQAQNFGPMYGPYPKACKNWLGIEQWEYMNLAKWVRENPTVELPYWVCAPAYGAYPAHTVGDFGFMPWPETIHAMASTKRAFAATWNSNGPGVTAPLHDLITRIKLHQSLPAFTNCNLDASPGDGDHADAEKTGGINIYQLWEPETILDQPDRWEITLTVRPDCAFSELITDVTPRRCQRFKARPGEKFHWSLSPQDESGAAPAAAKTSKPLQEGTAVADQWGLVTVERLRLAKDKRRLAVWR
jgi:hypothetical protein